MRKRTFTNGTVTLARPTVMRCASPEAIIAESARVDGRRPTAAKRRELRQYMRRMGCWGFLELSTRKIYFWARKGISFGPLLDFFAHEVAHSVHEASGIASVGVRLPLEERRAEVYAAVAGLAFELAREHST